MSYSPRQILYPVLVLAILASECQWTGPNTSYKQYELDHHLRYSRATYVVTSAEHLDSMETVTANLDADVEIILFSDILKPFIEPKPPNLGYRSLHDLAKLHIPLNTLTPLSQRLERVHPQAPATLMSTSGTTGFPKMADRSHEALVTESASDEQYDANQSYAIRRLFCTPIFHSYSFPKMIINPLRQGHPTYFMTRFDDSFAQKIADFNITDIITVPPILSRLAARVQEGELDRAALTSLRTVLCAGAPLTKELREKFLDVLHKEAVLVQEWGMTECGCITRMHWSQDQTDTYGSVGQVVGGYQVTMDKVSQFQLADGRVVAELLVRGPQMMTGYFNNADATSQAFAPGSWYRTGDVGYLEGPVDGTAFVYIMDRVKDIIKTNGWQVSPAELEAVAKRCPGITDACAVSAGYGVDERPRIFTVRVNKDVSEKDLIDYLGLHLSRHKIARCEVRFIDGLPRAPSGKVLRRMLRVEMEKEGSND